MSCPHIIAHGYLYKALVLLSSPLKVWRFWLIPELLLIWVSLSVCCVWEAESPWLGNHSCSVSFQRAVWIHNTQWLLDSLPDNSFWQQVCLSALQIAACLTLFKGNSAPWSPTCNQVVNLLLAPSHNTWIYLVLELVVVFCKLPNNCLMKLLHCIN